MYLNEYQDTFPPYKYADAVGILYWGDLLKTYVNDDSPNWGADSSPCADVFFCPAMGPTFVWNGRNCSTKYMGFAYNNFGLGGDMWGNSVKLTRIQSPDRILCLAEAAEWAVWYIGEPTWSTNKIDAGELIHYRHQGGNTQERPGSGSCNVFYVDGHIKPARHGEIQGGWDNFYLKYPYMEPGW